MQIKSIIKNKFKKNLFLINNQLLISSLFRSALVEFSLSGG